MDGIVPGSASMTINDGRRRSQRLISGAGSSGPHLVRDRDPLRLRNPVLQAWLGTSPDLVN